MGDMSPGCYFQKAANTTFHDLTKAKMWLPRLTNSNEMWA